MNYTANHHLPQWASSDRVRMDDFNQMNQNLETSLNSAVSKADAAQTAAAAAKTTASSAQTAASAAQTAAAAAQKLAAAAFSPDQMPFVTGSYTGDGSRSNNIKLGFFPSFVIVSGITESSDADDFTSIFKYFAITSDSDNVRRRIQLYAGGFILYAPDNYGKLLPSLNEEGRLYDYIAFR